MMVVSTPWLTIEALVFITVIGSVDGDEPAMIKEVKSPENLPLGYLALARYVLLPSWKIVSPWALGCRKVYGLRLIGAAEERAMRNKNRASNMIATRRCIGSRAHTPGCR